VAGEWCHDLLDNMYCADNGRYYETPIDWYGLARQFGYASWHQSALFFKRNVLAGCFIPHKLLRARCSPPSRWTGLCSAMLS
jgi:capsid portal protein